MSGIRHDNSAQLCVLLCETMAFPKGPPKGGEKGMVCHWYITMANGKTAHLPSEVFTPKGSVQLDWCAFLVLDAGVQADVRLTVADLAGNHLCAHFGTTKNLAKSDQFDIRELKLEDVNGVVAMMTVHAASQMRWTGPSAPKRELGSCDFLPADDAQALHIWKFLFPSRPPPKARSELKPIKEEAESEVLTPQKTQAVDADEEEEEEEEEGEEEEEQEEDAVEEVPPVKEQELQERRAEEGSEREAKEREAKEREANEREAKEREAKEREAKERQAKEREAKEREAKERDAKEREAKEREAKEQEAKEREAQEREAKEREAKEREVKEREAKEREAKEQEAKAREIKERDAKEMERAKDAHRRRSQDSQIRLRQSYLRKSEAGDRERILPRQSLRAVRSGEQERLGRRDSHLAPRGSLSAACPASTPPMQAHLDRRPVDRRWLEASDSEEELHFDSEPGEARPSRAVHQGSHRQHFPVPSTPLDTVETEQKDARQGARHRWEHGGPKWPPSRSELLGGQEPALHDTKSDLELAPPPPLPASGEETPGFPEQLRQIQEQLHQQQVQLKEQLQLQRQLQHRWPSPFTAGPKRHSPAPKRQSWRGSKTQQIAKPMASDVEGKASGGFPATVEGRTQSSGVRWVACRCRRLYRVTTRDLGIRAGPDVTSPRTGAVLKRGAVFEASVVAPGADGRIYLKLSGWRGWAFDDSAVDPMDPSVEALNEQEVLEILTSQSTSGAAQSDPSHLTAKEIIEPSTLDPLVLPRRTEVERKPRGDGWSTPSGTPEADACFPPHRISASPDEVLHPSISHEFREAMGLRRPMPDLARQL